jgi:predicted Abi (CAAX) family protease
MDVFVFDETSSQWKCPEIILGSLCIVIISQILTLVVCKSIGIDIEKDIQTEKDKMIKSWKDSDTNLALIISSEILGTIIYPSLAEELVFKFFIMKKILVEIYGINPYISNVIQSILFSLTHYINVLAIKQDRKYTSIQLISTFITGIVGGIFYIKSNNLAVPILAHMINNSAVIIENLKQYIISKKY